MVEFLAVLKKKEATEKALVVFTIWVKREKIEYISVSLHVTKLLLGEYKGNKSHSFSWSENWMARGHRVGGSFSTAHTLLFFLFGFFEGIS